MKPTEDQQRAIVAQREREAVAVELAGLRLDTTVAAVERAFCDAALAFADAKASIEAQSRIQANARRAAGGKGEGMKRKSSLEQKAEAYVAFMDLRLDLETTRALLDTRRAALHDLEKRHEEAKLSLEVAQQEWVCRQDIELAELRAAAERVREAEEQGIRKAVEAMTEFGFTGGPR